ncbi:STAS domain-containing protein [Nocardioides pacificus]
MTLRIVSESEHVQVIEIDGDLDCVGAYDLGCAVREGLAHGRRRIRLDLTRVTAADPDGAEGLRRCMADVVAADGELSILGISRAAFSALATIESIRPRSGRRPAVISGPPAPDVLPPTPAT